MEEAASLSNRIELTLHELSESRELATSLGVDKLPAIVVRGKTNRAVRFFGFPSSGAFGVFVETLVDSSRGSVQLGAETAKQLRRLKSDVRVEVLIAPGCTYSPPYARMVEKLGLQSARVRVDVVQVSEFPAIVQRWGLRAVPTTVIADKLVITGAIDEETVAQNILRVAEGRNLAGAPVTGPSTPVRVEGGQQEAMTRSTAGGLYIPR
jgi:alkyl hydroperoxide reductase subunit AhpF